MNKALKIIMLIFFAQWVYGQEIPLRQIYTDAVEDYFIAAGSRSALYIGKEQTPYAGYITNHPYVVTAEYTEGTVCYDGLVYPHAQMRIDPYRDELVVASPNNVSHVVVQNELVDYVLLHGYRIVRPAMDGIKGAPGKGYYLQLYAGDCLVLEKLSCALVENRRDTQVTGSFRRSTRYYIVKDNVFHQVKSKGSVLKALRSHRKELNEYSRTNRLNFGKSPGTAIVTLLKEYERLNRQP